MIDSVASDGEKRVHEAMVELDKAIATVAAYEARFMAPRVPYEPASPSQIAEAQKASREASPRYKNHKNTEAGTVRRQRVNYRNYVIHYDQKPVPGLEDWSFSHEDFDGAPDGPGTSCSDHRCGYAETPKACKAEIDAQYVDLELDKEGHYT